jgi:asparagine synthase (glutamine-hydrolysing)
MLANDAYIISNVHYIDNDEMPVLNVSYKLDQEFDDGKNVLRKAIFDFIPETIINRKKQGFSAPDESWYRGENADYIKELLFPVKKLSIIARSKI